jgi:hypothetical protein
MVTLLTEIGNKVRYLDGLINPPPPPPPRPPILPRSVFERSGDE